jgi:beta-glucosidase
VADILFGEVNPSGKLAASFPRAVGQIPIYYAHKRTGRPAEGAGTKQFDEAFCSKYLDVSNAPLYSFGYGLSYTTFAYSDLRVETPLVDPQGTLTVSATVTNTASRPGEEVVQLYICDLVASVTRPVKQLAAFQRITLQPGEARTVRFEVPAQQLGFIGLDMEYKVEPGAFKVWIGPNSTEGVEGKFTVRGA